jgi:hypothetical protein
MSELPNSDFKIAYDGTWYHEGVKIERQALAKLFSDRALKRDEAGKYWLQTPFEKYAVEVEDVPFVIIDFTVHGSDIDFITNMGEIVAVGPDHPIELRGEIPYIMVRDGLYARLGRAVYYNLVEKFGPLLTSRGGTYKLGHA